MKYFFYLMLLIGLFVGCGDKASTDKTATTKTTIINLSAEDQKSITDREISTWQFAKIKDFARLKEILRDDYIGYFGKNSLTLTEAISSFQNSTIHNYRMYNIKVKPVAANTAIIYYNLHQEVTGSEGDAWIPEVASSTVYIKDDGTWRSVFYHETPMGE